MFEEKTTRNHRSVKHHDTTLHVRSIEIKHTILHYEFVQKGSDHYIHLHECEHNNKKSLFSKTP